MERWRWPVVFCVIRGMSSSSKREESEEKLLQSSRRGDLDTVLVSSMFLSRLRKLIVWLPVIYNKNNQYSIHLAETRFICEKSHHKQMLESSWIMKILNVGLHTLFNTYPVDMYKFTGNTKAFYYFFWSRFLE